jgi:methylmalonyl-CoA/ethylmalonyl-CoA epimerase
MSYQVKELIIMLKKIDHHIAYRTDNITGQLEQANMSGCRLIHEAPFEGAGGQQVAFIHPKSSFGVPTEFCAKGEKI